uniref:Uncharacterized protein n=1 Tax=Timema cristinae TaxID=61476 RepID=A0A7R9HAS0_TIMCR|nr:unnamed protein product [Timema cristinae]
MDNIQRVIQTFDVEDAVSIREAKIATSSSSVVSDLAYVKSYFDNLPGVIVSLKARDLPLIESVRIMHTIQEGVKQTPGPVASAPGLFENIDVASYICNLSSLSQVHNTYNSSGRVLKLTLAISLNLVSDICRSLRYHDKEDLSSVCPGF